MTLSIYYWIFTLIFMNWLSHQWVEFLTKHSWKCLKVWVELYPSPDNDFTGVFLRFLVTIFKNISSNFVAEQIFNCSIVLSWKTLPLVLSSAIRRLVLWILLYWRAGIFWCEFLKFSYSLIAKVANWWKLNWLNRGWT